MDILYDVDGYSDLFIAQAKLLTLTFDSIIKASRQANIALRSNVVEPGQGT